VCKHITCKSPYINHLITSYHKHYNQNLETIVTKKHITFFSSNESIFYSKEFSKLINFNLNSKKRASVHFQKTPPFSRIQTFSKFPKCDTSNSNLKNQPLVHLNQLPLLSLLQLFLLQVIYFSFLIFNTFLSLIIKKIRV